MQVLTVGCRCLHQKLLKINDNEDFQIMSKNKRHKEER